MQDLRTDLELYFLAIPAFICVVCRQGVVTSEHSWWQNITGKCRVVHREGGLWELVVYFASEGSCSAKYTLYHNNRERLNSYNYVVTVYVNMLNHSTSSHRAKGEPGANRTSSRLGKWVTWGHAPAAGFSWKPPLAFPRVCCWWRKCFHVCCLSTFSHALWVKRPASMPVLSVEVPRCAGESKRVLQVFELQQKSQVCFLSLRSTEITGVVTSPLALVKC